MKTEFVKLNTEMWKGIKHFTGLNVNVTRLEGQYGVQINLENPTEENKLKMLKFFGEFNIATEIEGKAYEPKYDCGFYNLFAITEKVKNSDGTVSTPEASPKRIKRLRTVKELRDGISRKNFEGEDEMIPVISTLQVSDTEQDLGIQFWTRKEIQRGQVTLAEGTTSHFVELF
jgi:hypothetical protein